MSKHDRKKGRINHNMYPTEANPKRKKVYPESEENDEEDIEIERDNDGKEEDFPDEEDGSEREQRDNQNKNRKFIHSKKTRR